MSKENTGRPDEAVPSSPKASIPDAGTVVQIINSANVSKVVAEYKERHGTEDGWGRAKSFEKFKAVLNESVAERSDFVVVLSDWLDDFDGKLYVDVSGDSGDEHSYAIEFCPWGQWKFSKVQDRTTQGLTLDQMASEIYNEMTWAGWPDDIAERWAEILDKKEELDRAIDAKAIDQIYHERNCDGYQS